MIDFYTFWVLELWGGPLISLFGTALIYALIAFLGRMPWQLASMYIMLYFITFGVAFYGIAVYLLLFLFGATYFTFQLYKFIVRE